MEYIMSPLQSFFSKAFPKVAQLITLAAKADPSLLQHKVEKQVFGLLSKAIQQPAIQKRMASWDVLRTATGSVGGCFNTVGKVIDFIAPFTPQATDTTLASGRTIIEHIGVSLNTVSTGLKLLQVVRKV